MKIRIVLFKNIKPKFMADEIFTWLFGNHIIDRYEHEKQQKIGKQLTKYLNDHVHTMQKHLECMDQHEDIVVDSSGYGNTKITREVHSDIDAVVLNYQLTFPSTHVTEKKQKPRRQSSKLFGQGPFKPSACVFGTDRYSLRRCTPAIFR